MGESIEKRRRNQALWRRRKVKNQRSEIIALLGSICVMCGFSDERALSIDHVNGGGLKERKKDGGSYYTHVLKRISSGVHGYQLLCCNCNQIKKVVNNEERHKIH